MLPTEFENSSFQFSSLDLAPTRRIPALKDVFNDVIRLSIETDMDCPVEMMVHADPGFRRTAMTTPLTAKIERTTHMLSDSDDSVCLMLKLGGHLALKQRGREAEPECGGGVLMLFREPGTLECSELSYVALRMPFSALAAHSSGVEAAAARAIPRDTEALHLLRAYLASLPARLNNPQLGRLAAAHIYDLVTLAIGATQDGEIQAQRQGLRAARIDAIKHDLTQNPQLNLDQLATRHGVSARYIQMLLDEAGTTFSAFVLERRLDTARAMLTSPRYVSWTVAAIALEAGFGDLSYFNRRFKQRFLMTPTDLRAHKG